MVAKIKNTHNCNVNTRVLCSAGRSQDTRMVDFEEDEADEEDVDYEEEEEGQEDEDAEE